MPLQAADFESAAYAIPPLRGAQSVGDVPTSPMAIEGSCQAATFEGSSWFMPGDRRHISGRQTGPRLSPKRTEADRRIVREWPT